jgi:spermidine synthase
VNERPKQSTSGFPESRRFLPLLLLFAGSGCAALIYEIVWFQMLQLVIGSTAVSLGVLLGTFMGGMCLGSLASARVISPRRHPLRVLAFLELGVGVCGMGVLLVVPVIARVYVAAAESGQFGFLLRGAVCATCLLPPTVLMGATLPVVSRWVTSPSARGVSWVGFLYGANIAGAVLGSLLAGFYLLRVHDVAVATCIAATLNGLVALVAASLSVFGARATEEKEGGPGPAPVDEPPRGMEEAEQGASPGGVWAVYVAIALSGMSALSAEVVWTRLLSLMLGATVYTFSIILAVFLMGLGIGSALGSFLSRAGRRPGIALGACQLLLVGAIALAAHLLAKSLPYWPVNPSLARSQWLNFQVDVLRCAWALLPATCLWGASFPLALAAAAVPGQDRARLTGGIYAANTLGAIAGAVTCSLLLIPWLGTQQVQRVMMGLSAIAGLLVIVPWRRLWVRPSGRVEAGSVSGTLRSGLIKGALVVASTGCAILLAREVPKVPWELVAYGRYLPTKTEVGTNLYMGEGMNASVAVVELSNGIRNFHVSGKVEASTDRQDMRLQRMLGHLPALLHPQPRSVLVVGCGAGVTAGSFTVHPTIAEITICEIEPLIPKVVARYFGRENYQVVENPRVNIVFDDARHYVLTSRGRFDIITSDPIHPWVKGAATLYTREYFEACKQHLNPGGLVTQWVPLYESSPAAVKSELATFFEVFPNGTIWSNDYDGQGYDLVLLGQTDPLKIDLGQIQRRLNRDDHQRVLQSLRDAGFKSAFSLLATYAGQACDLKPWLQGAEINRDRNLRLQYLAGLGLNLYQPDAIFSDMLSYRRFPKDLFVGSDEWNRSLRSAIERPKTN